MKTTFQIVKAFAIVLAVMIIITIIGSIATGVELLGLGGRKNDDSAEIIADNGYEKIKELDINVKATELRIVESDDKVIQVETTSKYLDQWQDGGALHLVERSHGIFGWNAVGVTTVHLPKNTVFENVIIEAGAGELKIETDLSTHKIGLKLGAGHVTINGLYVSQEATIKTGAGLFEVSSGKVQDLNLNLGAGKAALGLRLVGSSKIKTGAGKLELNLLGDEDDYRLTVDKGIGQVSVNGQELNDGDKWGSGVNLVDLESGVGAVEIQTRDRE